jgi:hypothetical protein
MQDIELAGISQEALERFRNPLPFSRFPPMEVFVRRPSERVAPSGMGRHPKTFTN